MSIKHNCIKCSTPYEDDDPDPYYCEVCNEERKRIAKEVDKKMANMPRRESKSELQMFDELARSTGARGGFVNIKHLGIEL